MKLFTNILKINNVERTNFQIFIWWELRRFIFNVFLIFLIVIGSRILGFDILKIEMGNGEYFLFLGMVILIILLNIIYTFGWMMEVFRKERSLTFAPSAFKNLILLSLTLFCIYIGLLFYALN